MTYPEYRKQREALAHQELEIRKGIAADEAYFPPGEANPWLVESLLSNREAQALLKWQYEKARAGCPEAELTYKNFFLENFPMSDNGAAPAAEDLPLTCFDCGREFQFTVAEQAFYARQTPPLKQPKRCKPCRERRRQAREESHG